MNTSSFFAFSEVEIEDPEGRQIAHAAGQLAIRRVDPLPPPPPSRLPAAEEPVYPSPDPYLRRVTTPEVPREELERQGGLSFMRRCLDGTVVMPISELYGMRFLHVDEGCAVTTFPASGWFSRFSREVAPGVVAAVANATWWAATLTLLRPGDSFAGLEQVVRFYREVPADGRALRVGARTTVGNRNLSVAEVSVFDANGVLVASESATGSFIEGDRRCRRPRVETKRVLATLLFVDIVGSTEHANQLGDAQWRKLLDEHRATVREEIARHEETEIDTAGDGFFVRFETPVSAIDCARAVRTGVKRLGIDVRAGIHTGECEMQGRELSGIAVHIAARVEGAAARGEILVSSTVKDVATGSGLRFEDRGEQALKGVPDTWHLYALAE